MIHLYHQRAAKIQFKALPAEDCDKRITDAAKGVLIPAADCAAFKTAVLAACCGRVTPFQPVCMICGAGQVVNV
jgi:hypothetical protein